MFETDFYRRLIIKTQNQPRKINTSKPWFPKQRQDIRQEYKYFALPPNKLETVLKKQKLTIPTDEQIRDFLRYHSLKHMVYYGDSFHQDEIQLKSVENLPQEPIKAKLSFKRPPQRSHYSTQHRTLKKPIVYTSPPSKQQPSISFSNKIKTQKSERSHEDLYSKLRKLNYSPMQAIKSPAETPSSRHFQLQSPTNRIPIPKEIPKLISANPPRTKKQLRSVLLRALNKIRKLGVDIQYVMKHKIFSKKPYEKPLSKELIHAAKKNNVEELRNLLEMNPYLVFDFDYYNMSALHWACKKGYDQIVDVLLQYHADIDAIDVLNRTPLILAVQNDNLEIVYKLLQNGAYPWSTALADLCGAIRDNPKAKGIITKARRLQVVSNWAHQDQLINQI